MRALLEIARRSTADLIATDLGFAVGPRLNAAGRLDDMSIGIRCLLSDEPQQARLLANELDVLNAQRREIEAGMQAQAQAAVQHLGPLATDPRRVALCLFDESWHQGVVGLVASRIKDRVGRPVVAFAPAGDGVQLRGSARSIPGIHIRDVFEAIATRGPGSYPALRRTRNGRGTDSGCRAAGRFRATVRGAGRGMHAGPRCRRRDLDRR